LFEILRSLVFYALFYTGTLIVVLVATPLALLGERYGTFIISGWAGFHRLCVTWVLGIKVELRGTLPQGGALVAFKHESFFEAIELPGLFNRPGVFAKAALLRMPIFGRVGAAHGLIPVEREQGAKALRTMLAAAKAHARTGRVLVIFPEGTRMQHGTAPPLQAGFAGIYKVVGLPVVPVAVISGPLYHRRWKRRGTIIMSVGEPIPPGLPRAEIEARVHEAINRLNS